MTDTMTLEDFQKARQKLDDAPVKLLPYQLQSPEFRQWADRQIVKQLAERNIANGVGRDKIDFAPRFIDVMRAE